jgi:hypothetical protein
MLPGMTRYWQLMDVGEEAYANRYREDLIALADKWYDINPGDIPYAGNSAHAMHALITAYHLTNDKKYLDKAGTIADNSLGRFFTGAIPTHTPGGTFKTSGNSDTNSGVTMLPMAMFMLGYELEHPDTRIRYQCVDR